MLPTRLPPRRVPPALLAALRRLAGVRPPPPVGEREGEERRSSSRGASTSGLADLTAPASWYPRARAMPRRLVAHWGPTNSGKTHAALAALKAARSGVYAGPLRLLALEVYDRLNADGVPCNLVRRPRPVLCRTHRCSPAAAGSSWWLFSAACRPTVSAVLSLASLPTFSGRAGDGAGGAAGAGCAAHRLHGGDVRCRQRRGPRGAR